MINDILSTLGLSAVGSDLAFAVGSLWLWFLFRTILDFVLTLINK